MTGKIGVIKYGGNEIVASFSIVYHAILLPEYVKKKFLSVVE